jgi:succinyl-diaminopimelate desuccinylase
MGQNRSGDQWLERGMTDWLQNFFQKINVPHQYLPVESDRGNVVAVLEGDPNLPTILLDAHTDTVPVEGMTIDPFQPKQKAGRLYGRGTCDVKGTMASHLSVIRQLAEQGDRQHSTIIATFTCDEELGQKGAIEIARQFSDPTASKTIIPKGRIDMAIVGEPTGLNPVVAHKGTVRWKIQTNGVATHSSRPTEGVNAIYRMGHALLAIQQYGQQLQKETGHPLCGPPTLSVGTISGGTSVNIVPDQCLIEIDRRINPGEDAAEIIEKVQTAANQVSNHDIQSLPPDMISLPLVDDNNHLVADALIEAAEGICDSQMKGVPFSTHAPRFAELGIPTVVFGPGSISQAHTRDEWIEIAQLDQAVAILHRLLTRPVGSSA